MAQKSTTKQKKPQKNHSGARFFHVVLTGGPMAGKSTILNMLQEHFASRNVVVVPESATYAFERGFPVPGRDQVADSWSKDVSELLLHLTMGMERLATDRVAPEDGTTIVVHDRGLADVAAYRSHFDGVNHDDFYLQHGLTEQAVYARYDLVICLASLAELRPERFGKTGNEMRHETAEQAQAVSESIRESWKRHPGYHFISCYGQSKLFGKVSELLEAEIRRFEAQPREEQRLRVEIERKFELKKAAGKFLSGCRKVSIRQGYLAVGDQFEVRLREIGGATGTTWLTIKSGHGLQRDEMEFFLPRGMFGQLWEVAQKHVVEKTRYFYPLPEGGVAEIDFYHGRDAGLVTAEVEFFNKQSADAFILPDLPVFAEAKEVTGDVKFSNRSLAML